LLIRQSGPEFTVGSFNPVLRDFEWKLTFPQESHYSMVEGSKIGILTPLGELSIFDIATGTKILHARLEGSRESFAFAVLADQSRLFVATTRRVRPVTGPAYSRDGGGRIAVTGRLYAIERQTGEVIWSKDVQGRSLDLRQPGRWPFLVLSGVQSARTSVPGSRPELKPGSSILFLDRGDGHIIHEVARSSSRETPRGWKCDPKAGVIAIHIGDGGVQLNFKTTDATDAPSNNSDGVPDQPAEPEVGPPAPPVSTPLSH
jgi:hypothetical protein